MKDGGEIHESPEKDVIRTPEKKIETFDDLRSSKPDRIDTFDDIRKQGSKGSIDTFDEIREDRWAGDKPTKIEPTEKRMKETPAMMEQKRSDQAVEAIKNIEEMKPEKWKTLDQTGKSWALRNIGYALRDAYHTPDPPLISKKMEPPSLLGTYSDGDYMIRLNEDGFDNQTKKKLFGDDPKEALTAFAHEFRHSYQDEQAIAFDQGFKVDDPVRAKKWSENRKNYIDPPSDQDWAADPEQAMRKQEAYENQPKEKDSREFGKIISSTVYQDYEVKDK